MVCLRLNFWLDLSNTLMGRNNPFWIWVITGEGMNRNISNKPSSFTWLLPKILKAPVSDRSAPHSAEVEIAQLQGLLDVLKYVLRLTRRALATG